MSASVENPADCRLWDRAFAAKYDNRGTFGKEDWDQLLGHCQAVCDWPAIAFAEELIEAYPDAKIILTTRDVHTWHRSVLQTVDWRANDKELRRLSNMDYASGLYYPVLRKFWDVFFDGDFDFNGKQKYRSHYEEVRDCVRDPDKLLEFNIKDGWEPLCEFLQVSVPDEKFPHVCV
ncbi:hypothetical protein LTR10_009369 [Elasticomyces elasticus]|uniref:Sulfotransferase domain-containing protein n=1 Tax=Elasticomyces elasticus TaxID=574655 RepID=A0AAN7W2K0_9PEZI|nr:hypothetical protein LTR10_009369 [Elasticomyces elasticus]KAK4971532.1 hypothetical protein LTR42_007260 [Elasticomyces elasticus]KAK5695307.1 hypothetical protein LTR97_008813 [Elasticomyces elasticus]KAK5714197.1 hypothetical protein LTR15_011105 [Elasticomyces elasticus]